MTFKNSEENYQQKILFGALKAIFFLKFLACFENQKSLFLTFIVTSF
jgi:hypothetical protein